MAEPPAPEARASEPFESTAPRRPGFDPQRDLVLDSRTLRGIAHPLRVRMLGLLREHGPATATLLAERLGESTAATSYHLRQLAAYGLIVDVPDRGVGRERWWRAAHRSTYFDADIGPHTTSEGDAASVGDSDAADAADAGGGPDPETVALGQEYLHAVADAYDRKTRQWLRDRHTAPSGWRHAGTLSDQSLLLTPAEAEQLVADIFDLVLRYRRADEEGAVAAPAGARRVAVQFQVLPSLSADPAGPADPAQRHDAS